jgi:hypothetical protein
MMNPGGIRVSPREVEQALAGLPGVTDLAVTEVAGRTPARASSPASTQGRLCPKAPPQAFAAERLARYKQPRAWIRLARPAPHRHRQDRPAGAGGPLRERPGA